MVVTIVTELIIFIKIFTYFKLKTILFIRQSVFSSVNYLPCHYFVINLE